VTVIRTRTGVHSGFSVDTIVRRWFGRTASVRWGDAPASKYLGEIVKPVDGRTYPASNKVTVLDMLIAIEEVER